MSFRTRQAPKVPCYCGFTVYFLLNQLQGAKVQLMTWWLLWDSLAWHLALLTHGTQQANVFFRLFCRKLGSVCTSILTSTEQSQDHWNTASQTHSHSPLMWGNQYCIQTFSECCHWRQMLRILWECIVAQGCKRHVHFCATLATPTLCIFWPSISSFAALDS